MRFNENILREADIRGVYKKDFDESFATRLGKVFGTYLLSIDKKVCVIGHDNRRGGESLTNSLIEGITSTGIDVIYLGLVTTPMLNFASRELEMEYGIEVTASHNPSNDNGFKLFGKNYQHCDYDELEIIYNNLKNESFIPSVGVGKVEELDIYDLYSRKMASSVDLTKKRLKLVVDCGSGTASVIVRKIYQRLPIDVVYICSESDGTFPFHHPDPNVKENLKMLQEAVLSCEADLGVSYDGDADRCGFVDNEGNIIDADVMMCLLSKNILKSAPGSTILIDVKCTSLLSEMIEKFGGKYIIDTPSSARQERRIASENIIFGGGYSNHIFFKDRHDGYDDGIYVGLRVCEMLTKSRISLNKMFKSLNLYYNTGEIKYKTTDDKKWEIVKKVKEYADQNKYNYSTISGVKVFKKNSWALVRCSDTGPNLTIRFEAKNKKELELIREEFMNLVKSI